MSNVIRKEMYVKSDVNQNNNKFWEVSIDSSSTVTCRWGRVGDQGQSKTFSFGSLSQAEGFVDGKIREKLRDGRNGEIAYRKIDVVGSSVATSSASSVKTVNNSELARIASSQIKTNNPIVESLIKYFVQKNAHDIANITQNKIVFNDTIGLFSTPLGIVTQSNIDEANNLLVKIGDLVNQNRWNDRGLIELTNDYLMLIPQIVPRTGVVVSEFWSDQNKFIAQKQILDGLQASYISASSPVVSSPSVQNQKVDEKKVFDCQLHLVDDTKITDWIKGLYNKTRQLVHTCHGLDVKRVFKVNINTVSDAWNNDGAKMQNVWTLWHGTLDSHCLSILRSGLKKPSKSSSFVTGRMFSGGSGLEGLYFSDQSTKSLGYAYGYWSGTRNTRCYMFICSVAMGKYYVPSGSHDGPFPHKGYDSTFATAHKSGVLNNEMIIYRESQCNLDYLVEFE